jgi:hypothetical protein
MSEIHRRQSSLIVVDIQNPSTESLPISSFAMDPSTDHSSPDSPAVDLHDEPPLGSPTSSDLTLENIILPEGRFVQLINSDQIPRYEKNATMQVGYTILSLHTYASCRPRMETAFDVRPLMTEFP